MVRIVQGTHIIYDRMCIPIIVTTIYVYIYIYVNIHYITDIYGDYMRSKCVRYEETHTKRTVWGEDALQRNVHCHNIRRVYKLYTYKVGFMPSVIFLKSIQEKNKIRKTLPLPLCAAWPDCVKLIWKIWILSDFEMWIM